MSRTEIYALGGAHNGLIDEVRNSWRGAMYVWDDIAKRYLGFKTFFSLNEEDQKKVWNASFPEMTLAEHIVLMTTMDNATVKIYDVEAVASAFEEYGKNHPNSSFVEQAEILRNSLQTTSSNPFRVIAWNQTSVSEFWGEKNDGDGNYTYYDPDTQDKHFDAYTAAIENYKKLHETKS
jgi:hypothetical protein